MRGAEPHRARAVRRASADPVQPHPIPGDEPPRDEVKPPIVTVSRQVVIHHVDGVEWTERYER
ncbi:hypothetical protein GCM10023223_32590 [Stackebrandtia albiflava]